jgi:hypothetical protein
MGWNKMTLSKILACATLVAVSAPVSAQETGIRGDAAATAIAQKLLDRAGGAEQWKKRSLETQQTVYLRNGEMGELKIWRDFERLARRLERVTPTETLIEWLSPEAGWTSTNGRVVPMPPDELAFRLHGLHQEPYMLYHRMAKADPALRLELRDNGRTLAVFDRDERLLSWFNLDDKQELMGWGCYFNGNQIQHYYLAKTDKGNVFLPRFGVFVNGSYRFEYLSAQTTDQPVTAPRREP